MHELMKKVGKKLIANHLTISFAESATAGRLTFEFSMIENAGKFLKGGIACYDAKIKETLLNVSPELIKKYTPESMEVTKGITHGLANIIPADINIGITGLTAPGGSETEEKPVGTMFIYATRNNQAIVEERCLFSGEREEIVAATTQRITAVLIGYLDALQS